MIHTSKNYSFRDPACSDGDTFVRCSLIQVVPHTTVCSGRTGLVFRDCNLVNCAAPADSVVENCNRHQVSRCSHLHPELVERGLTACPGGECPHTTGIEELVVDGVVLDTIYTREDAVLE